MKVASAAYCIFLFATLFSLAFGTVNIISTLTLYFTLLLLLLLLLFALKKFGLLSSYYRKLQLLAASIVITLCLADLGLRYIIEPRAYLTYGEINGDGYYSLALRQKFRYFTTPFLPHNATGWFHTSAPNSTSVFKNGEFNYSHHYNHEGIRDVEIAVIKKKTEMRIAAFGDSFTEGIGAPQDSSWPALLNNLFVINGDTEVKVINAGCAGSDPFFEEYLFNYKISKYQPGVVMVAINNSDIDDIVERGGYERFLPDSTVKINDSPWWEPIYASSIVSRLVVRNIFHYNFQLMKEKEENVRRLEALEKLKQPIAEFIRLSKQNNFKLIIIFHPMIEELGKKEVSLSPLISWTKNQPVTVIDLYDEYNHYFETNHLNPKDFYWTSDRHHNSKGYQLWSNFVYGKLKEQLGL
ncbi:MAG: lipolytic protein family [Bacteroidota bacterium]|nr:lipolytic protein family [Bacteroidota bacterium]